MGGYFCPFGDRRGQNMCLYGYDCLGLCVHGKGTEIVGNLFALLC